MRRRLSAVAPTLLAAATTAFLVRGLAAPGNVLAARDVPLFHLPLRTAFARLAELGIPWWNPFLHGGQPVLSNPNYAAFYPPTWLAFALPPHHALQLVLLLHAALGLAGAWRLARHLGCRAPAAGLAALGFSAGGAVVSSTDLVNLFCGLAWLPWALMWGDRALAAGRGERWWRPAAAAAAAVAAQLLAGEPVAALLSALALACLGLAHGRRAGRTTVRLGALLAGAAGLAAVQLLPTLARLAGSPRAAGLALERRTLWSMPPQRLLEWLLPRFWGDPARTAENLYFGWGLHDADYPYVVSIYPGLAILLLACAALVRWPIKRRSAWAAMILLGTALALGRDNPLYRLLGELPPLSLVRYPEKFVLLATSALPFAAALGWQHLEDRRRAGDRGPAEFPLALAGVAAAVAGGLAALLAVRPDVGHWFARERVLVPLSEAGLDAALGLLRNGALLSLGVALGMAAILALARWRAVPTAALTAALFLLAAADLAHHGRRLVPVMDAGELLAPPPVVRSLPAGHGRIFSDIELRGAVRFALGGTTREATLLTARDHLEPYSANLWGLSYAVHQDYDLMATAPAATAWQTLTGLWPEPEPAGRFLGMWGVTHLVRQRSLRRLLLERYRGERTPGLRLESNPWALPVYRFTPAVELHADAEAARAALADAGWDVSGADHWVADPGPGPARRRSPSDARLAAVSDRAATVRVRYRAGAPAYFVAAVTWDRGWRARVDGSPVPLFATAAGGLGVELPATGGDTGELVLTYRDRWVPVGAAVSLLFLLLLTLAPAAVRAASGRAAAPRP